MNGWRTYLEETLGVKTVVRPWAEPAEPSSFAHLFVFPENEDLPPGQVEMVLKILAAVGLDPSVVGLIFTSQADIPKWSEDLRSAKTLVVFSPELGNFVATNDPQLSPFVLPSLDEMTKDPQAKKRAWGLLKSAFPTRPN